MEKKMFLIVEEPGRMSAAWLKGPQLQVYTCSPGKASVDKFKAAIATHEAKANGAEVEFRHMREGPETLAEAFV